MTTDIHDTDDMVRRPLGPLDYERMARDVKSHEECRWTAVPPIDRLRARQGLGLSLSEVAALCTAVGTKTTEGQVAKWETTEFPGVEDEAKSRAYRKFLTTVALVDSLRPPNRMVPRSTLLAAKGSTDGTKAPVTRAAGNPSEAVAVAEGEGDL